MILSALASSLAKRKALPEFFLRIFSSLTCLKKPVFSKRDLLRWKVPARLNWDSIFPCSQLHFGKVQ
jgi:hypothetical protein